MQFINIGMSKVMTNKVMESGLQDMDDEGVVKEKYGYTIMMQLIL